NTVSILSLINQLAVCRLIFASMICLGTMWWIPCCVPIASEPFVKKAACYALPRLMPSRKNQTNNSPLLRRKLTSCQPSPKSFACVMPERQEHWAAAAAQRNLLPEYRVTAAVAAVVVEVC